MHRPGIKPGASMAITYSTTRPLTLLQPKLRKLRQVRRAQESEKFLGVCRTQQLHEQVSMNTYNAESMRSSLLASQAFLPLNLVMGGQHHIRHLAKWRNGKGIGLRTQGLQARVLAGPKLYMELSTY